jgi:hypothetical protein
MRRGAQVLALSLVLLLVPLIGSQAQIAAARVPQAKLLPGGRAVAPSSAPPAVKAMNRSREPDPPSALSLG